MNDRYRRPYGVAQVGVGGYGRSHLASIAACSARGLCRLRAVTIREQDADGPFEAELAARGVAVYRDAEWMFDAESGRCALAAIPTGIPSHRILSTQALSYGYHVVCEKPAAGTTADVEAMRAARDEAGRILAVGYQYIYSASVQMLKSARLDRRWGELVRARCIALCPRSDAYYARNEWAGRMESGGTRIYDSPAQNAVSHFLNTMLYLAGESKDASARIAELYGENYRAKPIESADTQFIRGVADSGVEIGFWCSHAVAEEHGVRMILEFDEAVVEFERDGAGSRYHLLRDEVRRPFGAPDPDAAIRERVFEDAFAAIAENRSPLSSIDNASSHTELIEMLFTRCAPVVTVGAEHLETVRFPDSKEDGGAKTVVIRGLDRLALAAFEKRASYSEMDAAWAVPGSTVSIR